jgi:hypothetical protein
MLDFFTQFAKEIHSFFHNTNELITKLIANSGELLFRRSSTMPLFGKGPASRGLCKHRIHLSIPVFSARREAWLPAWALPV